MTLKRWLLVATILIHYLLDNDVTACNIYIPKSHVTGVLTNTDYPNPERSPDECQYLFDMYTVSSTYKSMVCFTFQRLNLPSQYEDACSSNFIKLGVTKGAFICGTMQKSILQNIGALSTDGSDVKVKWPTICYVDSHLLEMSYRIGRPLLESAANVSHAYFATYAQYVIPATLQCGVPVRDCADCSSGAFMTGGASLTDCPECLCPSDFTAEDAVSEFSCEFTGNTCRITPDTAGRWRSVQANREISRRGPRDDHTYGMFFSFPYMAGYMYLAEIDMYPHERATLRLPSVTVNKTHCLQFWYFMSGSHVGRLEASIDDHVMWFRQGDQGATWQQAQILFEPIMNPASNEYIRRKVDLIGEALYNSPDFGGIAVDDISLHPGPCLNQRDLSCTFENGHCNWQVEGGAIVIYGLVTDHTESRFDRKSLQISADRVEHHAVLTSPYVTEHVSSERCLSFWYLSLRRDLLATFYLRTPESENWFSQSYGDRWLQYRQWTRVYVDLFKFKLTPSAYQIQISFRGNHEQESSSALLDDIQLTMGACRVDATAVATTAAPVCTTDGQVRCGGSSRECIYQNQLCDGKPDCLDGWDEYGIRCNCPSGMFRCLQGECIRPEFRCDNIIHCRDGSDEANSYARCNDGPVLSVGAIIGTSFGVMCLCVLLVTLCAWGCVYAKNRRLTNAARRYTPRRPRSLHEMGLEPYMIDCPEAPPSYFSVVNFGFEPPVDPPPSYESAVAARISENTSSPDFNIPRLSIASLNLASFRELLSRAASLASLEVRPSSRTASICYPNGGDPENDEMTESDYCRDPSSDTDVARITEERLVHPEEEEGEGETRPRHPGNMGMPSESSEIRPRSVVCKPSRAPPLPPRAPPPIRLTEHLRQQSDLSDTASEAEIGLRQPSWRAAVARRLSEAVGRLPPPDVVSEVTEIPPTGQTFV